MNLQRIAKRLLSACVLGVALFSAIDTNAIAPPRSAAWVQSESLGSVALPYAESICNTDPDIILCDDFNGGPTYYPVVLNGDTPPCSINECQNAVYNPAQTGIGEGLVNNYGVGNRYIRSIADFPALNVAPYNTLSSNGQNYVHVINHDSSYGRTNGYGALWYYIKDVVNHTPSGGASGVILSTASGYTTPITEFHVRFLLYFTWTGNGDNQDYVPDGFPKLNSYNNSGVGGGDCAGHKIVFWYTPGGTFEPAGAATDGGIGADCGLFHDDAAYPGYGFDTSGARYGNALQIFPCGGPCNYESWPLGHDNAHNRYYSEYAPYQSNSTSTRPLDSLIVGRIFRYSIGVPYWVEAHIKWSNPQIVNNGISELWINGVKIYSNSDLRNCWPTGVDTSNTQRINDNCVTAGLGALFISNYTGSIDPTIKRGQQVIDNLVVTVGDHYIGFPSESVDITPPAAPSNVRAQ